MIGLTATQSHEETDLARGRTSRPSASRLASANDVVSEIARLRVLEAGWDSYGARPIEMHAIHAAVQFARTVALHLNLPLPQVVPTPSGGVQLEWNTSSAELEVEFEATGAIVFVFDDLISDRGTEGEVPGDDAQLFEALDRLSRSAWMKQ